ncbi:MAG: acyl-CoA-binding protein [Oceanococcus sp.]
MSDLKAEFEATLDQVKNAPSDGAFKPSNEMKLQMYAWFNQASKGDVSGKRPGMLDMIGRAKYDAWAKVKGMSADDAMQAYIDKVKEIDKQFG